jgi:tagatose 1,6-diphosphate aldolase
MMKTVTIGKYRGLQQISNSRGHITMCALDHRGSLQKMLAKGMGGEPSYQDMVTFKLDICEALSPHASAMLLDPVYGAAQALAAGVYARGAGLLVSTEETGYSGDAQSRVSRELQGWGVRKIRRMGASGAKLLLYYRPDVEVAKQQQELVKKLAKDCADNDLAFIVEPVSYAVGDEAKAGTFSSRKPEIVIKTAAEITPLGVDVLKAEFPVDMTAESDVNVMSDYCKRLNDASVSPWIILSAGVGFEDFVREVEIAARAGASGFLGGRALWQESTSMKSREQRREFFQTTVVDRLRILTAVVDAYGAPWQKRVAPPAIAEDWYKAY